MTHHVKKSQLVPFEYTHQAAVDLFGQLVQKYIAELTAWSAHQTAVRAHDEVPEPVRPVWNDYEKSEDPNADYARDVAAFERAMLERPRPYPEPEAPADVMASVRTVVTENGIEYVADFEVDDDDPSPAELLAKHKLELIGQVGAREAEKIEALQPPVGRRRLEKMREDDILVKPEEDRTPEENGFLIQRQVMHHAISATQRAAAEAMAAIEDLTLDNIGQYELPTF